MTRVKNDSKVNLYWSLFWLCVGSFDLVDKSSFFSLCCTIPWTRFLLLIHENETLFQVVLPQIADGCNSGFLQYFLLRHFKNGNKKMRHHESSFIHTLRQSFFLISLSADKDRYSKTSCVLDINISTLKELEYRSSENQLVPLLQTKSKQCFSRFSNSHSCFYSSTERRWVQLLCHFHCWREMHGCSAEWLSGVSNGTKGFMGWMSQKGMSARS